MSGEKRVKFAIVDDDEDIVLMLENSIRKQFPEYSTLNASNGLEALDLLETEKPDIMILDITMPELDGLSVLKKVRARHDDYSKTLPIIILTAKKDSKTLEEVQIDSFTLYTMKSIHNIKDILYFIGEMMKMKSS